MNANRELIRHAIRQAVAMARAQNWRAVELKRKGFTHGAARAQLLRDEEIGKARAIKHNNA